MNDDPQAKTAARFFSWRKYYADHAVKLLWFIVIPVVLLVGAPRPGVCAVAQANAIPQSSPWFITPPLAPQAINFEVFTPPADCRDADGFLVSPCLYFSAADIQQFKHKADISSDSGWGFTWGMLRDGILALADIPADLVYYNTDASGVFQYNVQAGSDSKEQPQRLTSADPDTPYWTRMTQEDGKGAITYWLNLSTLRWLLTRDIQYYNKAYTIATAICNLNSWSDPGYPGMGPDGHACIDTGHLAMSMAFFLDATHAPDSPLETAKRQELYNCFLAHLKEYDSAAPGTGALHETVLYHYPVLSEGRIAGYPEQYPNAYAVVSTALATAGTLIMMEPLRSGGVSVSASDVSLARTWIQDGMEGVQLFEAYNAQADGIREGQFYGSYPLDFVTRAMTIADRFLGGYPLQPVFQNVTDFLWGSLVRFDAFSRPLDFGDFVGDSPLWVRTNGYVYNRFQNNLAMQYLRDGGQLAWPEPLSAATPMWAITNLVPETWVKFLAPPSVSGQDITPAFIDKAYPKLGYGVTRSGWNKTGDRLTLFYKAGPENKMGHNHSDAGSFMLNFNGTTLFSDYGYGNPFPDLHSIWTVEQTDATGAALYNPKAQQEIFGATFLEPFELERLGGMCGSFENAYPTLLFPKASRCAYRIGTEQVVVIDSGTINRSDLSTLRLLFRTPLKAEEIASGGGNGPLWLSPAPEVTCPGGNHLEPCNPSGAYLLSSRTENWNAHRPPAAAYPDRIWNKIPYSLGIPVLTAQGMTNLDSSPPVNWIANPGFNDSVSSMLPWYCANCEQMSCGPPGAYNGCIKLTKGNEQTTYIHQIFSIPETLAGQSFTATFAAEVKTAGDVVAGPVAIYLYDVVDGQNVFLDAYFVFRDCGAGGADWRHCSFDFVVPSNAKKCEVYLDATAGDNYWDDIVVRAADRYSFKATHAILPYAWDQVNAPASPLIHYRDNEGALIFQPGAQGSIDFYCNGMDQPSTLCSGYNRTLAISGARLGAILDDGTGNVRRVALAHIDGNAALTFTLNSLLSLDLLISGTAKLPGSAGKAFFAERADQVVEVETAGALSLTLFSDDLLSGIHHLNLNGYQRQHDGSSTLALQVGAGNYAAMIDTAGYMSLHNAYAESSNGNTILLLDAFFPGNVTLNRGVALTLKGGYNPDFQSRSSYASVLEGFLSIETGSLTVDEVTIGPAP